jgi:hypothetical protein
MKDVFTVNWTGSYPNLCSGVWETTYNGESVLLPEDKISSDMDTSGTYSSWYFED